MAFLSAVIGVRDSSGVRVDSPDALGNYLPIVLKLGSNLTSSVTQSGGVSVVTIIAAGGGGVTSVSGTTPINSSGGATPAISIDAASAGGAGSMSAAHYSLVNGATDAATASTIVKRDASSRFKAADPDVASDVATKNYVDAKITGAWRTAASVDFKSESNQTLATDTTYTIGGYTFTKVNSANDSVAMAVVNGSGLVIQPNSTADWGAASQVAPGILLALSTITGLTLNTPIRWTIASSTSNETDLYRGLVCTLQNGTNRAYFHKRVWTTNGGPPGLFCEQGSVTSGAATQQKFAFTDHALRITLPMGIAGQVAIFSSAPYVTGAIPADADFTTNNMYSLLSTGWTDLTPVGVPTSWSALIAAQGAGSSGYSVTIERCALEFML